MTKLDQLVNMIKQLRHTDQIVFARLYRDQIKQAISGNTEAVNSMMADLREWSSLPDES